MSCSSTIKFVLIVCGKSTYWYLIYRCIDYACSVSWCIVLLQWELSWLDCTGALCDICDSRGTHKFWRTKMSQSVSDSEIMLFPFPWAESEFHLSFILPFSFFSSFCITIIWDILLRNSYVSFKTFFLTLGYIQVEIPLLW